MIVLRWLYSGLGIVFFALGLVGMLLPVLPTVPFWLASAACFLRGSRRLYRWLMTHPRYGSYIYMYREARALTPRSKATALITLWVGIAVSVYLVPLWPVQVLIVLIAAAVTVHLSRFRTLTPQILDTARAGYRDFVEEEFGETLPAERHREHGHAAQ